MAQTSPLILLCCICYFAALTHGMQSGGAGATVNDHASKKRALNDNSGKFGVDSSCLVKREADLRKPIQDVLSDHGDPDAFCHFGFIGDAVSQCAMARKHKNYTQYANFFSVSEVSQYDKSFCQYHGFLDLPREKIADHSAWSELSDWECEKLVGSRSGEPSARILKNLADREARAFKDGKPHRLMHKATFMCNLGGVGCEMANCALNFCRLEKGKIGHGAECQQL